MDFEMIDGLSDDEIMTLYFDAIVDGINDGVHTGSCSCRSSNFMGHSVFGGCEMLQSHGLYSQDACSRWCTKHGYSLFYFTTPCYCLRYSEGGGTYGYLDRCGT